MVALNKYDSSLLLILLDYLLAITAASDAQLVDAWLV